MALAVPLHPLDTLDNGQWNNQRGRPSRFQNGRLECIMEGRWGIRGTGKEMPGPRRRKRRGSKEALPSIRPTNNILVDGSARIGGKRIGSGKGVGGAWRAS